MSAFTREFWTSLALLLAGLPWAPPALACSIDNLRLAEINAVIESGYYWMASFLIGGVVICIEVYRGRLSPELALTVGLLIFHPTWTLLTRDFFCGDFANAMAAKAELELICALAGLTLVRFIGSNRNYARVWRTARNSRTSRVTSR